MSTRCSCSPMRNTLQRRLSSRSSSGEYSCTVSTPFWSSSVPLGLGRSSERRTSSQSSQPGHAQLPGNELGYNLTRSFKHLNGRFLSVPSQAVRSAAINGTFVAFHSDFMHSVGINTGNHLSTFGNFCLQHMWPWMKAHVLMKSH